MKTTIYLGVLTIILSCSNSKKTVKTNLKNSQTFEITEISSDTTYGLSSTNPIQVGGVDNEEGPLNERRYLNALAGPNGEQVSYFRAGSCCPIKSKKDPLGFGVVLLDNYRVTWKGAQDTVSIFINMYDYGILKAPVGFSIKK